MSDYVATVLMSRALPEIQHRAPGIAVEVLVPSNRSDRLDRGEADLMIIPKQYLSEDHPSEPLFADEFVCVAWAGKKRCFHGERLLKKLSPAGLSEQTRYRNNGAPCFWQYKAAVPVPQKSIVAMGAIRRTNATAPPAQLAGSRKAWRVHCPRPPGLGAPTLIVKTQFLQTSPPPVM
jgi:DNA-binding transcriptional LysR family regulator